MAVTRATSHLYESIEQTYVIKTSSTITVGLRVKLTTTEGECDVAGADDIAIGTCISLIGTTTGTGVAAGTAKAVVAVGANCIVPTKVGAAGVTRGAWVKNAASGTIVDAGTLGGGTAAHTLAGIAVNGGVSGDLVGLLQILAPAVAAS